MKRFVCFILIFICLMSISIDEPIINNNSNSITYIFWSENCYNNYSRTNLCGLYEYRLSYQDAKQFKSYNTYSGEGVILPKEYCEELDNFIYKNRVDIISQEYIQDRLIMMGYSPHYNKYYVNKNVITNVQISVSKDYIIIGIPFILGSF